MPVSRVKHWRFCPEEFLPDRTEIEMLQWASLEAIKLGWERLDASLIFRVLDENFTYGSYWVKGQVLDLAGYCDYLAKKFETILKSGTRPKTSVAVLYEGLTPERFHYALCLTQGSVTCLLTVAFNGEKVSSLYMTEPDIFTYEPTFRKGGITGDNGEPMPFVHCCNSSDKGRKMTPSELQAFAVECVVSRMQRAGGNVTGVHRHFCKAFPNIITKCGSDTFYHRIDVFLPTEGEELIENDMLEFVETAQSHNAYPMSMPISLWCMDSEDASPVCGGTFFVKVFESRIVNVSQK